MRINDLMLQQQLPSHHSKHAQDVLLRPAAVLLPLIPQAKEDYILFTLRSQKLRNHRGQIAFPGGKRDPGDTSLAYTALRETHEEIGVPAEQVKVLGAPDFMSTRLWDACPGPWILFLKSLKLTRCFRCR